MFWIGRKDQPLHKVPLICWDRSLPFEKKHLFTVIIDIFIVLIFFQWWHVEIILFTKSVPNFLTSMSWIHLLTTSWPVSVRRCHRGVPNTQSTLPFNEMLLLKTESRETRSLVWILSSSWCLWKVKLRDMLYVVLEIRTFLQVELRLVRELSFKVQYPLRPICLFN